LIALLCRGPEAAAAATGWRSRERRLSSVSFFMQNYVQLQQPICNAVLANFFVHAGIKGKRALELGNSNNFATLQQKLYLTSIEKVSLSLISLTIHKE